MKILRNSFFIIKDKKKQRNFIQILLLLMLITPSAAQETLSLTEKQELEDRPYYIKSLVPMFISMSYQFGIVDYKDIHQIVLNSSFNIDFEIHGNISFKPRLYTAFFYAKVGGIFSLYTNPKLKGAWGISGYVYNARNKNSKLGWSIIMGAGFAAHFDMENRVTDEGYEVFLRGQYNFHKHTGFIIGLSFEHLLVVDKPWSSFESVYSTINTFNLGVHIGLAF